MIGVLDYLHLHNNGIEILMSHSVEVVEIFIEEMKSDDKEVGWYAAGALGRSRDERAVNR